MSATPQIKPSPSHIPEFDRVMRELAGVDPNEIDNDPAGIHRADVSPPLQPGALPWVDGEPGETPSEK